MKIIVFTLMIYNPVSGEVGADVVYTQNPDMTIQDCRKYGDKRLSELKQEIKQPMAYTCNEVYLGDGLTF